MPLPGWPPGWDQKVKRYLQLGEEEEAQKRSKALWQEALSLAQPSTWHQIISIESFNDLFKPYAQDSQALQRLLTGSGKVALMTVSLGPQVEERSRELLAQQEIFGGFIMDRVGSYLAEWCMSSLDRWITEDLRAQGLKTTRRYSPGYQDFSLHAQKVFVDMAAEDMPLIKLRTDYSLAPEKSVTALKGVGP